MSNLTVKGNASGTGTIILESPNTNSNRTITLPDSTSTLATTAQVDAISSIVHLGTIATTSGSSASLSGLTLTGYKQVQVFFSAVSGSAASSNILLGGAFFSLLTISNAADSVSGGATIDLASGLFFSAYSYSLNGALAADGRAGGGQSGLSTSSTSITFTTSTGNFDAGSIRIYGVK